MKLGLALLDASSNWSSKTGHFQRLAEVAAVRDLTSVAVLYQFHLDFFGLRNDYGRNESTEFLTGLLIILIIEFVMDSEGNENGSILRQSFHGKIWRNALASTTHSPLIWGHFSPLDTWRRSIE